jgi:DnaJ family protein C protein 27
LKIISVGNQESGKSCLIKRYCEGRFVKRYISTIGIDYGVKKLEIMNRKVCINFFDLSGNDEYKQIRTEFYKDACGVIMVFDVDNRDSYISLVQWEEEMKRYGIDMTRIKVVVCGNKCDSKGREVKEADAKRWASQRNWGYFETSASEGKNV